MWGIVEWVKIDGFRQITGSMSKTVQVDAHFLLKSNSKSYALYLNLSNSYLSINVTRINHAVCIHTHTHTHTPVPERQKPIWILLKQETVSGSGICWAICKYAPRSRQIPRQHPTAHFLQAGCPSCRPTNSVKALKAQLCVYMDGKVTMVFNRNVFQK